MKQIWLGVVIFLASSHLYAANDQIPIDRVITRISAYEQDVVVYFEPGFANTQGCPHSGKKSAVINMENEKGRTLYSSVLTAAAAKTKVGFGLSGCKNHPLIYRVDIDY